MAVKFGLDEIRLWTTSPYNSNECEMNRHIKSDKDENDKILAMMRKALCIDIDKYVAEMSITFPYQIPAERLDRRMRMKTNIEDDINSIIWFVYMYPCKDNHVFITKGLVKNILQKLSKVDMSIRDDISV